MTSISVFGQIQFNNNLSDKIKVTSLLDKTKMVEIAPRQSATVPFLKEENGVITANIQHWKYKPGQSFVYVDDGNFTLSVLNGQATVKSLSQKRATPTNPGSTTKQGKSSASVSKTISDETAKKPVQSDDTSNGTWSSTANFVVQNLCTKTITGYSGDFLGLCLKPKKVSGEKITHRTGNLQAAFGYDEDIDSIATGKNRKWAVLDKSVTEGMDTLKIYNSNLVLANTGQIVSTNFRNQTSLGYLIMNDNFTTGRIPSNGDVTKNKPVKTISPRSNQRINFFLGWNVMCLQYKDERGFPKQAVILFLVTEGQKDVKLMQSSTTGASINENELKIE